MKPSGPYLEFTVEKDGATAVQAQGFKGVGCKEASAPFERALGVVVNSRETDGGDTKEARLKAD